MLFKNNNELSLNSNKHRQGLVAETLLNSTIVEQELKWRVCNEDFDTIALSSNSPEVPSSSSKPIVPPIVTSSIFMMKGASNVEASADNNDGTKNYVYGSTCNPTRDEVENLIAKLDGAQYGLAFGSGSCAITSLVYTLKSGDHCITSTAINGGTWGLFNELGRFGIHVDFVAHAHDVQEFTGLVKPNTKLILVESPSNPTLTLVDIQVLAMALAGIGRYDIILAVDNTFCTPIVCRPLELGATAVLYSASKYLNGHGDVIMGGFSTNSKKLCDAVEHSRTRIGGVPSPFDCYLLLRSLTTLPIRMRQHSKNGLLVAKYLEEHPNVESVIYPGLKSHPQHSLALKQQYSGSGMVGFYIKGGYAAAVLFLSSIQVFRASSSLGDGHSLASIPALLSHEEMPINLKEQFKITNNLIRLSIGLEGGAALLLDLAQALEATASPA